MMNRLIDCYTENDRGEHKVHTITAVNKALVNDEFSVAATVSAAVSCGMLPLISLCANTTSLSHRGCSAPYTTWATSTGIINLASPSLFWLLDDSAVVLCVPF